MKYLVMVVSLALICVGCGSKKTDPVKPVAPPAVVPAAPAPVVPVPAPTPAPEPKK